MNYKNGFKFKTSMAIVSAFVAMGLFSGCAELMPKPEPLPTSKWGGNYTFKVEVPEKEKKAPGSVKVTVAIVNPSYKEAEVLNKPEYSNVVKGFVKSLAVDVEKIIVEKGMTIKGPFTDIEEMTFPDKKDSDLTLTPKVGITAQIREDQPQLEVVMFGSNRFKKNFEIRVGGYIAFEMREPLSNEKLWVKKLDVTQVTKNGVDLYEAVKEQPTRPGEIRIGGPVPKEIPGGILYNGREDAMADALNELYPEIMNKLVTYLNPEEMMILKAQAQELREKKRY